MLEFSPPAVSTSASMLSFFNMDPQQTTPFMLGSPPLAALHSMTEMKQAMMQYNRQSNGAVAGAAPGQAAGGAATPTSSGAGSPVSSVIPHGIDSILNRPSPGQLAFGSQLTSQINSQLGSQLGSRLGQSGVYLNSQLGKSQLGEFGRPSPLAWPGLQGMIQNPVFWRERFSAASNTYDRDGKKKHTRPTFSGQQIFALEKTFEQTKYLAGPERAKLAYALGMSESQVKVWFQNRRTKWRKRHAAEMATAKRKQEEAVEGGDAGSDSDEERQAKKIKCEAVE